MKDTRYPKKKVLTNFGSLKRFLIFVRHLVVVAQEPKRFTVEQRSEQSCASGSTPLPTTKFSDFYLNFH